VRESAAAFGLPGAWREVGEGSLPSAFAVSDLAAASFGVVGEAVLALGAALGAGKAAVTVDRRRAALWFSPSITPEGWALPPVWDELAGDYRTADGWIKLHTNAPHHRAAALRALDARPTRDAVAGAVASWRATDLEAAVLAEGGVAAEMRSLADWAAHPQGAAVAAEPLVAWDAPRPGRIRDWGGRPERPLHGLRVLDLTRILAGPVATRTLAGFGAEVLRIDPPDWEDAGAWLPPGCARPAWSRGRLARVGRAGADRGEPRCLWLDRAMGGAARVRQPRADVGGDRPCRDGPGRGRQAHAAAGAGA